MELSLKNIGRKWKNESGIYCLEINEKNYIGSALCLNTRLKEHDLDLRNEDHGNEYLMRAFKKHKKCSFSVLELCGLDILIDRETYWYELMGHYNILHPKKRTGGKQSKKVYQYNLDGNLIGTYISTGEAARLTDSFQSAISVACRKDAKCKFHNGFLWSYSLEKEISRLTSVAKKVHVYSLTGEYLRSFYSAEEAAKVIATEEKLDNYLTISSHLRSCATKEKGSVLYKYQIRFYKEDKIPEFKIFHKSLYKSN